MVYSSQQKECFTATTNAVEHFVGFKQCSILSIIYLLGFFFLSCREQENDLERRYALLNQELRAALSVEDWRKSEAQREREALLLAELVSIVNKRDELVQHLHSQEKA